MLDDDILFHFAQRGQFAGVFQCKSWMQITVRAMARILLPPIVVEQIVQNCATGRRAIIKPQAPACEKADIGYTCDVLETVDIQMLLID